MSPIRLDLTGKTFNHWTVISFSRLAKNGATLWNCRCVCGNERELVGSRLNKNKVNSCGCKVPEISRLRETTHGMAKTPLHCIWLGMKTRCYNKNTASYKSYGERGIVVCARWLNSFENFHSDMSGTYEKGLTLERKDVNKGYSPENCCWIPRSEQSRNRTNTIWVETELGKMTVTEAAKKAGISWFAMYNRHVRKCPIEKMLSGKLKAGRSFTDA